MSESTISPAYHFYKPFTVNLAGFIIPMVTGFLSTLSSGLIFYVILKSEVKLHTTYHRIMAFMSLFDIISSTFIGLGSIMVPSDSIYKFAGPRLGNPVTCHVQGWLIVFGISGSIAMYVCISWYFVLSISFKMQMNNIQKYIEPIMFLYSSILSILIPSYLLSNDMINPNSYDSFCTIAPYPDSCDENYWYDWNFCAWGEGVIDDYIRNMNLPNILFLIQFVLILMGISIILWTICRNMKDMKDALAKEEQKDNKDPSLEATGETIQNDTKSEHVIDLKYSRVMINQALMYILAFFVTWILNGLSGMFNISNFELDAINCIFFPLQGFWNLMIFLYDKTYLMRQVDDSVTFSQACKKILLTPSVTPVFVLSNLSAVDKRSLDREHDTNVQGTPNDNTNQDQRKHSYGKYRTLSNLFPMKSITRDKILKSPVQSKVRRVGMFQIDRHICYNSNASSISIELPIGVVSNSISS